MEAKVWFQRGRERWKTWGEDVAEKDLGGMKNLELSFILLHF